MDHLCRSLCYVEVAGISCEPFGDAAQQLVAARFDYQGDLVVQMEDINAEEVVAAWPKVGQAAIQDAVKFLPDQL